MNITGQGYNYFNTPYLSHGYGSHHNHEAPLPFSYPRRGGRPPI